MSDNEKNPWTTISSKKMYGNPWISVREDQVIRPDGNEGIYGVVDTKTATGVVALNEKNEVYLVGQYRYPTDEYSWEIVEGGGEPGEEPEVTIERELAEEAGLIAKNWEQLGSVVHLSNCFSSEVAYLYVAWELTETEMNPDDTEVLQVKTATLDECFAMIDKGEIKDAMSVIALHRVEKWLQR